MCDLPQTLRPVLVLRLLLLFLLRRFPQQPKHAQAEAMYGAKRHKRKPEKAKLKKQKKRKETEEKGREEEVK